MVCSRSLLVICSINNSVDVSILTFQFTPPPYLHPGNHKFNQKGLPGGPDGKASAYSAGDDPRVGKIPWRRQWHPTPGLLPGKSHGRRRRVGYSPWGCKEWDTTERLPFYFQSCLFSISVTLFFLCR